jgi:hypothetical protein
MIYNLRYFRKVNYYKSMAEHQISWNYGFYHSDINIRDYDRIQISFIRSRIESKIKYKYETSEKLDV